MLKRTLGVLALTVLACGVDDLAPPPPPLPPPPIPAMLAIVSGNNQQGSNGETLPEALKVRVVDATGNGVFGVEVRWAVPAGSGDFSPAPQAVPQDQIVTFTDSDGLTGVFFRPMLLVSGTSAASAIAAGLQGSPATFLIASVGTVAVIDFGPLFDCGEPSEFRSPMTVPLGTKVTWVFAKWMGFESCSARVVSQSVPLGGEPFDSSELRPGQSFSFVPSVAGVWTYGDVIYGGTGKLIVTP